MSPDLRSIPSSTLGSRHFKPLTVGLGLMLCVAVMFAFNPANLFPSTLCPFHALTGFHCPGCGVLRALHQLLRGNVLAALGLNPLIGLSLPIATYGWLSQASNHLTKRPLPKVHIPAYCVWTLAGIVIAFWVLRNIPVYPFSALAP